MFAIGSPFFSDIRCTPEIPTLLPLLAALPPGREKKATASGETVSIAGFGKFEPVIQKANQNQTNPQDPKGPKLQIPEKRRVKFRPYKHLAGVVEGTEEHKRRSGKD